MIEFGFYLLAACLSIATFCAATLVSGKAKEISTRNQLDKYLRGRR